MLLRVYSDGRDMCIQFKNSNKCLNSAYPRLRADAIAHKRPAKGFAAWQALTKALFDDYRPELHYMRGPGPKWHEKHDRAEIDGVSPAVTRALMAGLRP